MNYRELSLMELARLVVEDSDRQALYEIHDNRSVFVLGGVVHLLLAQYLNRLRLEWIQREPGDRGEAFANRAYDLALDRFFNLPSEGHKKGSDCRNYFRAFLQECRTMVASHPKWRQLEIEAMCGYRLRGQVYRHFIASLWEARREANPFLNRYRWEVKGGHINLWLPRTLEGKQRRAWLEENIPDADPARPFEKERVQDIVDRLLPRGQEVAINDNEDLESGSQEALQAEAADNSLDPVSKDEVWCQLLSKTVANEKARNLKRQRPAIRALGPDKLRALVLRIFEDLLQELYEQNKVAKEFGLSISTMSRFSGCDWRKAEGDPNRIPDLWRNTAQVIAKSGRFTEMAKKSKVFGHVLHMLHPEGQYPEQAGG
jgi:hypothetical protein